MKSNLPYLFVISLAVLIASSCSKDNIYDRAAGPLPTGTFSGYFEAFHTNPRTKKSDTTFEWVTLKLSGASGFTIKGDTTVHAGSTNMQAESNGAYALNGFQYMGFSDKTLPAAPATNSAIVSKYHLNGLYIYAYNARYLSLITASSDTLYLSYSLSPIQEPAL